MKHSVSTIFLAEPEILTDKATAWLPEEMNGVRESDRLEDP